MTKRAERICWAEIREPSLRFRSFVRIPEIVANCSGLSPAARLLYGILVRYAWKTPTCFPGQQRLLDKLGCAERSLRGYLDELVAAQLIDIRRRGFGRTNFYTFLELIGFEKWSQRQSGTANSTGHDPALFAGHDRSFFAGHIDEVDKEGIDKATTTANLVVADVDAKKRQQAFSELQGFGLSRTIAAEYWVKDPDLVLAVIPFLKSRLAEPKIKNPGGQTRDVLANPAKYDFEFVNGHWKPPPTASKATRVDIEQLGMQQQAESEELAKRRANAAGPIRGGMTSA